METTKSIFASKTAWLGAALTILGGLQAMDLSVFFTDPKTLGGVVSGIGVAVLILRTLTTSQVTVTGKP